MTTLQPLIFATWTQFAEAHPDWATCPVVDGVRTHPQTGSPSLIVEGWFFVDGEWQGEDGHFPSFDLTTTELHAACWLADRWARWCLLNQVVQSISEEADDALQCAMRYWTTTPTALFSAVGKRREGMKDG